LKERNVNNQHPETCSLRAAAGLTLSSLQVEISRSVAWWQNYRRPLFYTIFKPLLLFYQFLTFSLRRERLSLQLLKLSRLFCSSSLSASLGFLSLALTIPL